MRWHVPYGAEVGLLLVDETGCGTRTLFCSFSPRAGRRQFPPPWTQCHSFCPATGQGGRWKKETAVEGSYIQNRVLFQPIVDKPLWWVFAKDDGRMVCPLPIPRSSRDFPSTILSCPNTLLLFQMLSPLLPHTSGAHMDCLLT